MALGPGLIGETLMASGGYTGPVWGKEEICTRTGQSYGLKDKCFVCMKKCTTNYLEDFCSSVLKYVKTVFLLDISSYIMN